MLDYVQYLKDSHLDTDKFDLIDLVNNDEDDAVLNEYEADLIGESCRPSEQDTKSDVFPDSNDTDEDDDTRMAGTSFSLIMLLPTMPANYDSKTLLLASIIKNKIDLRTSVYKILSSHSNRNFNTNINKRLPYLRSRYY